MTGDKSIEAVSSRCPECGESVASLIVERDGKVYQHTQCSSHGVAEHLIFSDSSLYRRLEAWNELVFPPSDEGAESQPSSAARDCGIHSVNPPALAVMDITNRCNFHCPVCFAETDGQKGHYYLALEQVREMLQSLVNRPVPCRRIQFSGGEPTLHPEFPRIVRTARELGFTHVQVATNGSRFANLDYTRLCEDAGLHTLYLQFDGMSDEAYLKLRGRRLLDQKIAIVENILKTNMRIVLVPTVAAGINVDQIGPLFQFALKYSKHITGISFQPAALTGRVKIEERERELFDLAMMAKEFGSQTGLTRFPEDWFPLNAVSMVTRALSKIRQEPVATPACDAHCSLGTYFYIDEDNKPVCITRFLDLDRFFRGLRNISFAKSRTTLGQRISQLKELNRLTKCFDKRKAPRTLTFERLLRGLDGWEDKSCGRAADWFRRGFNGMFVAGMHFMDFRTYNFRRVRRCIIQYVTTNGVLIPFCSYNAGARYRNAEELLRQELTSPVAGNLALGVQPRPR
jgi:uncharacterized radical SAM superfamily Fe-S cluster-containing enzyme